MRIKPMHHHNSAAKSCIQHMVLLLIGQMSVSLELYRYPLSIPFIMVSISNIIYLFLFFSNVYLYTFLKDFFSFSFEDSCKLDLKQRCKGPNVLNLMQGYKLCILHINEPLYFT